MVFHPLWSPPPWWVAFPQNEDRRLNVEAVLACLQADGGFGNWPRSTSYLECCFQAFVALNALDAIPQDNRIRAFLLDRVVPAGGFADSPGGHPALFNTFYASVCLNMLGLIDAVDQKNHVRFVRSHLVTARGTSAFVCMPGWRPSLISTFWGAVSLLVFGSLESNDMAAIAAYVERCWNTNGTGYGSEPGADGFIEYTYSGLSLNALMGIPTSGQRKREIAAFISSLYDESTGLFGERPGAPGTPADSMWAVACLAMISALDAIDLREHKRVVRSLEVDQLWILHCKQSIITYLDDSEPNIRLKIVSTEHIPSRGGYTLTTSRYENRPTASLPSRILDVAGQTPAMLDGLLEKLERTVSKSGAQALAEFDTVLSDIAAEVTAIWLPGDIWAFNDGEYAFIELTAEAELLSVPFELARIGADYLGARLACGRLIRVAEGHIENTDLRPDTGVRILLLGGSHRGRREVLPAAGREVERIGEAILPLNVRISKVSGRDLTRSRVRALLTSEAWDIVHFSGHTFTSSADDRVAGIVVADGEIEARAMAEWTRGRTPRLVFVNGCASSRVRGGKEGLFRWANMGMSRTWAQAGASYVGSYWSVRDAASSSFACQFYSLVGDGLPIGEALRLSKIRMRNQGMTKSSWVGYSLVGSPRLRLFRYRYTPQY